MSYSKAVKAKMAPFTLEIIHTGGLNGRRFPEQIANGIHADKLGMTQGMPGQTVSA